MNNQTTLNRLIEEYQLTAKDIEKASGYSAKTILKWLTPEGKSNHTPMTDRSLKLIQLSVKESYSRIKTQELSSAGFSIIHKLLTQDSPMNGADLQTIIDISRVLKDLDHINSRPHEDVLIARIRDLIHKYPDKCSELAGYVIWGVSAQTAENFDATKSYSVKQEITPSENI